MYLHAGQTFVSTRFLCIICRWVHHALTTCIVYSGSKWSQLRRTHENAPSIYTAHRDPWLCCGRIQDMPKHTWAVVLLKCQKRKAGDVCKIVHSYSCTADMRNFWGSIISETLKKQCTCEYTGMECMILGWPWENSLLQFFWKNRHFAYNTPILWGKVTVDYHHWLYWHRWGSALHS